MIPKTCISKSNSLLPSFCDILNSSHNHRTYSYHFTISVDTLQTFLCRKYNLYCVLISFAINVCNKLAPIRLGLIQLYASTKWSVSVCSDKSFSDKQKFVKFYTFILFGRFYCTILCSHNASYIEGEKKGE